MSIDTRIVCGPSSENYLTFIAPSKPWQDYDILGGRFVSEFGMPSMPCIQTVDWWLDGDDSQRYPQSKLMAQHNKAGSYERRLATYINEEFKMTGDLDT